MVAVPTQSFDIRQQHLVKSSEVYTSLVLSEDTECMTHTEGKTGFLSGNKDTLLLMSAFPDRNTKDLLVREPTFMTANATASTTEKTGKFPLVNPQKRSYSIPTLHKFLSSFEHMQQIITGDCLEIMRQMQSESIDLVVTDPPYLINYQGRSRSPDHPFTSPIQNDDNPDFMAQVIPEIYRLLKPNSAFYCFCSPTTVELFKGWIGAYFTIRNLIIWVKNNWGAGDVKAQYAKQYEIVIYANKGRRFLNGKRIPDIWFCDRVSGKTQLHQNQKPLDLLSRMIEKSSEVGDLVLDPFMGVGTTLLAAKKLSRQAIGIEIEKRYAELAKERLLLETPASNDLLSLPLQTPH